MFSRHPCLKPFSDLLLFAGRPVPIQDSHLFKVN